ncbi:MAG: GNAT family N-acetyltransferase [Cyclobacteriaceae bacterium]
MDLITTRLHITHAKLADAPFFYQLMNSSNWIRFIGDRGIRSLEDAEHYIQHQLIDSYRELGFGLFKMSTLTTSEPIGVCGFLQRDYLQHPDIGFAILPEWEGNGYTYEAGVSILEYGRSALKLNKILAITSEQNKRSIQLINRLGLKSIGKVKPNDIEEFLLFSSDD